MAQPECWLRGPVHGVPAPLMPVAHALLQTAEDVEQALAGLTPEEIWIRPDAAVGSCGFHARHVAGSTDRLFTYARGEALSDAQRRALAREQDAAERPSAAMLILEVREAIDRALDQLRGTDPARLHEERKVGRAGLPSSVLGLLFHAAEHAQRHAGQITTTAKILTARRS
jgi:uncharacterized damage-inducible protein DinB